MALGGNIGSGVKVGFSAGSSPYTFSKLEQLTDVSIPTQTAAKVDTTVHQTSTKFTTSIPGLVTVADPTITMLRDANPATSPNQNQMFGFLQSGATLYWRFEIPASSNLAANSFEAYEMFARVSGVEETAPIAGVVTVKVTLSFTGVILQPYGPAASLMP